MSSSTVFRNARLVGGDSQHRDLVVTDGVVAQLGVPGSLDLSSVRGEVIDLEGLYLGPGLWDNHVHFSQWALIRQRLDVSSAVSASDVTERVRSRLISHPPAKGTPLAGFGFRDGLWPQAPHRDILDRAGPAPVVLMSADIHCVWLNSAALSMFGLSDHPTGVLVEQDAFEINTALGNVHPATLDRWVGDAAVAAASRGVVGVVDMEMALTLDDWPRRVLGGIDQLRVKCAVYAMHLEETIARGLRTGDVLPETAGLITMGPFKIITDGSLNTRTAHCHDAYPILDSADDQAEHGGFGLGTFAFDELVSYLRRASSNGIVPAVHAIGDRANQLALDAFEAAACSGGIEHAQLISSSDFARFARLGVSASVQPEHAMDDRDVADVYWSGRTDRAFALDSLVNAGATLRFGSDAPVAPLDPWISMAAAVSRSRDGRAPWHPEQRASAQVAYAASTDGRRSVSVADVADLAITVLDPLHACDTELRSMEVRATMLGGRFTHNTL